MRASRSTWKRAAYRRGRPLKRDNGIHGFVPLSELDRVRNSRSEALAPAYGPVRHLFPLKREASGDDRVAEGGLDTGRRERPAPEHARPVSPWMRSIDVVGATVALLILSPLLVLLAMSVLRSSRGGILFAHRRIGRGGKSFPCLKFRTMVSDAEARLEALLRTNPRLQQEWDRDHKLKNDPRITPIGRFLRQTSLDELPQLLNVLRGEMSLVGPRPIVAGEAARYGRHIDSYYNVRPGLTGLWQVSGRNDVTYRRRVALDVMYCRRNSIGMNVWILFATIPAVLARRGSC